MQNISYYRLRSDCLYVYKNGILCGWYGNTVKNKYRRSCIAYIYELPIRLYYKTHKNTNNEKKEE